MRTGILDVAFVTHTAAACGAPPEVRDARPAGPLPVLATRQNSQVNAAVIDHDADGSHARSRTIPENPV
jgi:hypothetical protein